MGGSYRQCSECGKRALSIATRCPGCGRDLPTPPARELDPSANLHRFLSPGVLVAVVATTLVLTAAELARSNRFRQQPSSPMRADFPAAFTEVGYSTAAAAQLHRTTAAPAPLPIASAGEVFVTRTWTNVRRSRSTRADVEAVLLPSDTVLADSLERGWYRVVLEGEALGYVHRSALARP